MVRRQVRNLGCLGDALSLPSASFSLPDPLRKAHQNNSYTLLCAPLDLTQNIYSRKWMENGSSTSDDCWLGGKSKQSLLVFTKDADDTP